MIISKTPLRISFAGGGTDLPSFYRHNDYGAVLSTSIDSYIYVVVKRHSELFDEKIRLNYSDVERVENLEEIQNPIMRECIRFLGVDERLYVATIADAPGSSGLGSSSSFCVGLLNALYKFKGISTSAGRLAEEAAHIEIDILKRPIGKQDHYAAAYGGINYFRFGADGSVSVRAVTPAQTVGYALMESMLSFWLHKTRPAEQVLAEQDRNNPFNADTLCRMRDQADMIMELLQEPTFNLDRFGQIIHEGWELKKRLASNITSPLIDEYYAVARTCGAVGGKISGAGGGGFLNVFARPEDHRKIVKELQARGVVPYRFRSDSLGSNVMAFN